MKLYDSVGPNFHVVKATARHVVGWLDGQIASRTTIVGDRSTLVDIVLSCFTRFGGKVGQALDLAWTKLEAWHERTAGRPTARA